MATEYVDTELETRSINAATREFQSIYKEGVPYQKIPTINGYCYRWDEDFIESIQYAMSTDSMAHFSEEESIAWWNFVNYQNHYSTAAKVGDCNNNEIGATNYDENMKSYVVCKNGITTIIAQPPLNDMLIVDAWKSLDKAMMNILNCIPVDNCDKDVTIIDIAPCPIT